LNDAGFSAPHRGHRLASGVPQLPQNFMPSGLLNPQLEQGRTKFTSIVIVIGLVRRENPRPRRQSPSVVMVDMSKDMPIVAVSLR
jgi:hypothetical protein